MLSLLDIKMMSLDLINPISDPNSCYRFNLMSSVQEFYDSKSHTVVCIYSHKLTDRLCLDKSTNLQQKKIVENVFSKDFGGIAFEKSKVEFGDTKASNYTDEIQKKNTHCSAWCDVCRQVFPIKYYRKTVTGQFAHGQFIHEKKIEKT